MQDGIEGYNIENNVRNNKNEEIKCMDEKAKKEMQTAVAAVRKIGRQGMAQTCKSQKHAEIAGSKRHHEAG